MDPIKAKQERFKAMGIPVPIEKPAFDQPVVNVKDPNMLKRIQEIKGGLKKTEFNQILTVGNEKGFKPLPEPKKRTNPNKPQPSEKTPTLESFSPIGGGGELDMYDKMFSAEPISAPTRISNTPGQRLQEEVNYDTTGSDFLNNFRQKLQAKAMANGVAPQVPVAPINSGFGFNTQQDESKINLEEIEAKIYKISSEVAKKIAQETIKTVLDEYLSKKTNLQENTYKKIKDDIVQIDGKYYKLTPVKIKPKS